MRSDLELLHSALVGSGIGPAPRACRAWMREIAASRPMQVERIPLAQMDGWAFDPATGDLGHRSGKFFRVEGVHVEDAPGAVAAWDQPIINQPEIGILGFLARRLEGVLHLLVQVKQEPGNVVLPQLSPTVQATRSNYTKVHGGRLPPYLEYFAEGARGRVLVDQLQSEQGARFLRKRNRNMVVEIAGEIPLLPGYCWMTIQQLKRMLRQDDLVNMDARSVLACTTFLQEDARRRLRRITRSGRPVRLGTAALSGFGLELLRSLAAGEGGRHQMTELLSWFTQLKAACARRSAYRPLRDLVGWRRTDDRIEHETGDHFSIIAVRVAARSREIDCWDQPLVAHPELGVVGFLTQRIDGLLHFLVRAHDEPGTFDLIEMGPTVACAAPRRRNAAGLAPPFLEHFIDPPPGSVRISAIQSEEGGRFYHVRNRYMILELPEGERLETPPEFRWMTLGQIAALCRFNNLFSIEARGLIACLEFQTDPGEDASV